MFGWFKKDDRPIKCFACGGMSTRADIFAHYDLCNDLHILQGLSKGFMNASPNAVRKALGLIAGSSGSAIDDPTFSKVAKWCRCDDCLAGIINDRGVIIFSGSGDNFDLSAHERSQERIRESQRTAMEDKAGEPSPDRCVECHHILPMHSYKCSKPAPPTAEEIRTTSSTGGQKGAKPERHSLIPTEPIASLARLMAKGAIKYADHNWRKGYEFSKSYDALVRHLNAWWSGEDNDPEMQESHLAAVMFHCCVMMELQKTHPEFDDRYKDNRVSHVKDWFPDGRA